MQHFTPSGNLFTLSENQLYFGWMEAYRDTLPRDVLFGVAVALMDGGTFVASARVHGFPKAKQWQARFRCLFDTCQATCRSDWRAVLTLTAPGAVADPDGFRGAHHAWLAHYRLAALRNLGIADEAQLVHLGVPRRVISGLHFLGEDVLDSARRDMRVGRYLLAVRRVSDFLATLRGREDECSMAVLFSLAGCVGTCEQAMGRFDDARAAGAAQKAIIRRVPSRFLEILALRREASILVESDRFREASTFFPKHRHLFLSSGYPVQAVLFLVDWIRLALARGELEEVEVLFADVESYVSAHGLAREFLNLDAERCEWDLRKGGCARTLLPPLRLRLAENVKDGNDAASCEVAQVIARLLGCTRQALHPHLSRLITAGVVIREGRGRGTWYRAR